MTASILRKFYETALSSFDKALCELFIGAFFFAMRSCEYIQVSGPRKTKLLAVRNVNFIEVAACCIIRISYCIELSVYLLRLNSKNVIQRTMSLLNFVRQTPYYAQSKYGQGLSGEFSLIPPLPLIRQ